MDRVDRVQTIVGVDGGIGICRRYRYVVIYSVREGKELLGTSLG